MSRPTFFALAVSLSLLWSCAAKQQPILEAPPGVLDPEPHALTQAAMTVSPHLLEAPPPGTTPPETVAVRAFPAYDTAPAVSALSPAEVIAQAEAGSRVGPSLAGFRYGQSAMITYPMLSGRIFEVYSSPNAPTTLLLPPGERLAAPPTLNPEAWEVGAVDLEEGRQALVIRPLTAKSTGATALLCMSGRILLLDLKAYEKPAMRVVTWE